MSSNVNVVSFKISPEHYAVLKAMAQNDGGSISALCRNTIIEALDLETKVEELASFFAPPNRNIESEQPPADSPCSSLSKETA